MNRWARLGFSLMTALVLTLVIRTNNDIGECSGATCQGASWILTVLLFSGITIASLRTLRNVYVPQKGGNNQQ